MIPNPSVLDRDACTSGRRGCDFIVETMREMSLQADPQAMVRAYGARMRQIMPADRWISLSRRDLESPQYRITRSSTWTEEVNPWKEKDAAAPSSTGGCWAS